MLRYIGLGLGGLMLAAALLAANPAEAQRYRPTRWERHHIRRSTGAWAYRANRVDRDRDGIPDYRERYYLGRYPRRPGGSRVAGSRTFYRDFDRDGIPDNRDRDIDGDGVRNSRDRYDWNRFRR